MRQTLAAGKVPPDILMPLIARYAPPGPGVVVGPGLGLDAAVLDLDGRLLVAKTDPITFATDEIGWYAVHVNANDIAALGATPRWFLATLLLPEQGTTPALVETIFAQMAEACAEVGATLVGGHTEITLGLDRPIVVGQMLGETTPDRLVTAAGAQLDDVVLLTKSVGLEGTAILAREKGDELADLPADLLAEARAYLHTPGLSVVRDAALALAHGQVHAMHDPTEGGIATGLREVAEASGLGMVIDAEALPIEAPTLALCQRFGLDPLGLISSGALMICLPSSDVAAVTAALAGAGIRASQLGRVVPAEQGVTLRRGSQIHALPIFDRDELTRVL